MHPLLINAPTGKEVINNISLLQSLSINSIINCCAPRRTAHFPNDGDPDSIRHLHLDIKDEEGFDIEPFFDKASEFIKENLARSPTDCVKSSA